MVRQEPLKVLDVTGADRFGNGGRPRIVRAQQHRTSRPGAEIGIGQRRAVADEVSVRVARTWPSSSTAATRTTAWPSRLPARSMALGAPVRGRARRPGWTQVVIVLCVEIGGQVDVVVHGCLCPAWVIPPGVTAGGDQGGDELRGDVVGAGDAVAVDVECGGGRAWPSRPDTVGTGTPALSIWVAMKCRRSCSRNRLMPASRLWAMKVLVTRLGSQGHDPSGRDENTNAVSPRWRLFAVARASARRGVQPADGSSSSRWRRGRSDATWWPAAPGRSGPRRTRR